MSQPPLQKIPLVNDPECQKVNPFASDKRDKTQQVRQMFDNIAPRYDLMNMLMTMGIFKLWRRKLVDTVSRVSHADILDIATGTGDLALIMAEEFPGANITGLDLSEQMIKEGKEKALKRGLADRIDMVVGDSLNLPFPDESFDCVTVAYGVRNFEDLLRGYTEMHRVLRPDGTLCVLELSTPTGTVTGPLYNLYAGHVIPAMGRIFAGDSGAYDYLHRSIAAVPQGEHMLSIIRNAGFSRASYLAMTFGACTLYAARK